MKRSHAIVAAVSVLSVLAAGPFALLAATSGNAVLAWIAVFFYLVALLCVVAIAPFVVKFLRGLARRVGTVERDIVMLTNTIGRAAPVLRRIDDRGRALVYGGVGENSCSRHDRSGRLDIAIVVSSKAEAREAIDLFNSSSERMGRLVLVLSPQKMGRWGTWIDEDLGTGVHVVAGEHLLDGSASTELLFTSGLVACITSFQDSAARVFSHVVKVDEVIAALELESVHG
ncbi:hypothetical protein ACFSSC_11830 [Corynebacterium mendelii]|uniref:Uncharacterized protein n=2 Tax=Corynebacterium mendelii TaxID=2765362 RepID=A0A939E1L9_9CORY|nr:hypothetical protein [Corynebacterium mendelii]MBN9645309.1 hypothetical protein [Corynebacterium mendelii]